MSRTRRNATTGTVVGAAMGAAAPGTIAPRAAGAIHDAFVSNPEINRYPLQDLEAPMLVIQAEDDPLAP